MSTRLDFTVGPGGRTPGSRKTRPGALNVIIMGDFGLPALPRTALTALASGVLDELPGPLHPALDADAAGPRLEFTGLEAFRPESLARQIPACRELLARRQRLQDPATWQAAVAELRQAHPALSPSRPAPAGDPPEDETLFNRLLGAPAGAGAGRAGHRPDLEQRIKALVTPHIKEGPGAEQAAFLTVIDQALGAALRATLGNPRLQALEAAWRGVDWLLSTLDDAAMIQVWLACSSADVAAAGTAALEQALQDTFAGSEEQPRLLLVALHHFGDSAGDLAHLQRLGELARGWRAPLFAGASARLAGLDSFAQVRGTLTATPADGALADAWTSLRNSDAAHWIALAAPRFLLRQPYGRESDPVDGFDFEELPQRPDHAALLWGNPALACARLVCAAFVEGEGDIASALQNEISDLPLVTYHDGSGSAIMPIAEAWLSQADATRLLDAGLVPVLCYRNRNAVRVMQFRSVSRSSPVLRGLGD